MTDVELFDSRPARAETCPRCMGCGSIDAGYALHPWNEELTRIDGAPDGAVLAFVGGSFDVFSAAREAKELVRRSGRPVAFQFLDHAVVVRPDDDPHQVARAWWLLQYGETPEDTAARR